MGCRGGVYPGPQKTRAATTMQRKPARKKIRLPLPIYETKRTAFITIGTHLRHPWFSLFPEISGRVVEILKDTALDTGARLFAWCIMPDHLLVECENLVGFVRRFKGRATSVARAVDRDRRLWQRSFYDHLLRADEDVLTPARGNRTKSKGLQLTYPGLL